MVVILSVYFQKPCQPWLRLEYRRIIVVLSDLTISWPDFSNSCCCDIGSCCYAVPRSITFGGGEAMLVKLLVMGQHGSVDFLDTVRRLGDVEVLARLCL